jgi:hypothetical protein
VGVDRDTAAVVVDAHGAVVVDGDLDRRTVPCERFVDSVVDNLVDKMVKSPGVGRPNVHRWALLHCL